MLTAERLGPHACKFPKSARSEDPVSGKPCEPVCRAAFHSTGRVAPLYGAPRAIITVENVHDYVVATPFSIRGWLL